MARQLFAQSHVWRLGVGDCRDTRRDRVAVLRPNPAAWIAAAVIVPVIWIALLLTLITRRIQSSITR